MLKRLIRKLVNILKTTYQPKHFWDNWTEEFAKDPWQRKIHPQHKWMLKKIKAAKPESLLEIGCGFGRNIKFLIDNGVSAHKITGIDISKNMIKEAKKYIGNNKVNLLVGDAKNLKFLDQEFALTLVHGVFMHIKPRDIKTAIKDALRVTKNVLINVEQNYPAREEKEYTFVHNYKKLYKESGASIKECVHNKEDGLSYFYVKVR